jgi:hypothetical protein
MLYDVSDGSRTINRYFWNDPKDRVIANEWAPETLVLFNSGDWNLKYHSLFSEFQSFKKDGRK